MMSSYCKTLTSILGIEKKYPELVALQVVIPGSKEGIDMQGISSSCDMQAQGKDQSLDYI